MRNCGLNKRWHFTPFVSVLFGEYKTYFQELESEAGTPISDNDYPPYETKSGWVSNRSPKSPEDLTDLTDEELLIYINKWEKEDELHRDDEFVEINIEALADAFQTVFKESIIPDTNRLKFWIENREKIKRPIYVRAMINTMQANVEAKNFDQLSEWLRFSEWVLTHPDCDRAGEHKGSEESRENPDWSSTRRAVCDFIGTCIEKGVDIPFTVQGQLTILIEMLCTQFDSRLDRNLNSIDPRIDALTEGINSTRGRALEDLVKFGFWLRRHDSKSSVPEVTTILEKRFVSETEQPLTLPEYAILGRNYPWIVNLNKTWAIRHKTDFFPQGESPAWLAAFESLVKYSEPSTTTFKILQEDFDFALQHLADFKKQDISGKEPIDILGEHLFTYYLWKVYPLEGDASLLERYYNQTNNDQERWTNLFNHIGIDLWNNKEQLDQTLEDRISKFFEWRLKQKEPMELRHFTSWLQAECLDAEWRLQAYSKVLDICEVEDWGIHVKTLCEMLPNHTEMVVECFFKLTEGTKKDNIYIQKEEANAILKVGRESKDQSVRSKTELIRENLLNSGRFILPDLED